MGDVIGGDKVGGDKVSGDKHEHHYYNATPQPPDLDAARALLDQLPLEEIPEPQTLPAPHRMPLHPNLHFVGRADELRKLAALLKTGGTVAITTGIGGMGKTQLAAELAHRYGHYFAGGVFWVSCADAASIPAEVAACGLLMGLPLDGKDQQTQAQFTLAAWETDLPRLLIFDNCEDEALLRQWKPRTLNGARVLVTSRRAIWTTSLKVQTLPLDVLPRDDSVALLQQLAPDLEAHEAGQIAEALGDLPLALFLSGRYLARYPTPVEEYLARLASVQLKHQALQGRGVKDWPTDREPHVERAFALSFERLNPHDRTDILARALLARAGCFAPGEPFGRNWLEATITPEGDEEEQRLVRIDAVERLLSLGLVESVGEDGLRLHRLLVAYAQSTLKDDDALLVVQQVVSRMASQANETGRPSAMLPVLPHLRYLVQQSGEREDETVATLYNELGVSLNMVGAYGDALPLYERALSIWERVLGPDHPDTARSLNNLAELYRAQGEYERALPLYERALSIWERVLGPDHPDTAKSLNNLARLYWEQGEYEFALPLFEQTLAIRERILGPDHPDTATSLNNLAELHRAQGEYERALPLYERALSIWEQVLGPDHPDTARSLNNLAVLYANQGEYGRALPLAEQAISIWEQVLGPDHPDTATSLNNLAELYRAQGEYERALPLYKRAQDIRERVLGLEHPDTAQSLNNLALLYHRQGEYERALPLHERALSIRERVLGSDHPDVAGSLNNLAELYRAQGEYERALPLYERALTVREQVLGSDHPSTAQSLNNLALLYAQQGQYATALPLLERAAHIWHIHFGPDHPDTQLTQKNLAEVRRRIAAQGDPAPAGPLAGGEG
ncbi:MAG: hypothetical protein OHK0022_49030 [Roseiflexaceae bacterium]